MASTRKTVLWITGVGAFLFSAPLLLSVFGCFPWSLINCWHNEIDIHSGRVRYTRYLAFFQIAERIDETALSRALQPEDFEFAEPHWRKAETFSPRIRHSPHYRYHSAIHQIKQLEIIWELGEFSDAEKRSSAKRVLELWQQGEGDHPASLFYKPHGKICHITGERCWG